MFVSSHRHFFHPDTNSLGLVDAQRIKATKKFSLIFALGKYQAQVLSLVLV